MWVVTMWVDGEDPDVGVYGVASYHVGGNGVDSCDVGSCDVGSYGVSMTVIVVVIIIMISIAVDVMVGGPTGRRGGRCYGVGGSYLSRSRQCAPTDRSIRPDWAHYFKQQE